MNQRNFFGSGRLRTLLVASSVALAASLGTFLAVTARAAGIPATAALTYSGYLESPDGTPISSKVSVGIDVWNAATAGKKVCSVATTSITPVSGRFQVTLPDACTTAVGDNADLWLEATIDGTSLGRTKLGAVPYAVEANHAASANAAAGALQTQLDALQKKVDELSVKADADAPRVYSNYDKTGTELIVSSADWTWISGVAPVDLEAGKYFTFGSAKLNTAATGCAVAPADCHPYSSAKFATCMRVNGKLETVGTPVYLEAMSNPGVAVQATAFETFELKAATAKVEFGFCGAQPVSEKKDFYYTRVRYTQVMAISQGD